jgi:hypothetical protein
MAHFSRDVISVLSKGIFTGNEILALIERALSNNKGVGNDNQRLVKMFLAYVQDHYERTRVSREDMATFVGVSSRHLTGFLRKTIYPRHVFYIVTASNKPNNFWKPAPQYYRYRSSGWVF